MIERQVFDNGLCLLTESMPAVRSVSLGAWLTRGSRHEDPAHSGIAHFVEHMLFKGTTSRTAEGIAQEIDSIGGHLDAFTAKECASYYVKVLDEHLPRAVDVLSDLLLNPAFAGEDICREQNVVVEEIKMVEDTPDDLVYEIFTASFWHNHQLGQPILGTAESVRAFDADALRTYFSDAYTAQNLVIAAAGNIDHAAIGELVGDAFSALPVSSQSIPVSAPGVDIQLEIREKDLEQAHLCLGTAGYEHTHPDRHASYILNAVLGGSMSSRLFQKIREKRGLAYAVSSSLTSYHDVGNLTVYAGCDGGAVRQVIDLVVDEMQTLKRHPLPTVELQRAKDHLRGSFVLGLESTTSRMSQLARSEMYFGRQIDVTETLNAIELVTQEDVQRVACDLFQEGALAGTVVGPITKADVGASQLNLS
jgi:predicted Zn-dependent peptidase